MTLKFDGWPCNTIGAPLTYYVKLCASFQIHWWIQTGVTVPKHSIRVKMGNFLSCLTLKFDGWPWKTIGHLFILHQGFFQSFQSHQWIQTRLVCKYSIDLKIWWMTLINNRAPLLRCFKLCASFHSNQCIQTGVIVQKCPLWVKIDDFFRRVTLKFDRWPWKTIGHLS